MAEVQSIPGLKTTYVVKKAGSGSQVVQAKNTVTVHATGVVVETNKQFWSTHDKGQKPFTYQAGVGGVIVGWDKGCLGMKLGEVRCPIPNPASVEQSSSPQCDNSSAP